MFKRKILAIFSSTPALALVGASTEARATDGLCCLANSPTYYEMVLGSSSPEALESTEPGLPSTLAVDTAEDIIVEYRSTPYGDTLRWELVIDGFLRSHERVDAPYQVVMVVPLPVDEGGKELWRPLESAMRPRVNLDPDSPPLLYRGRPLTFKRDVALEKAWLSQLVGPDQDKLADLSGSNYRWTLWDTLVVHDPEHGDDVGGSLQFQYETPQMVTKPDPNDSRFSVYIVTWIPSFTNEIPPYAIRIPITSPES